MLARLLIAAVSPAVFFSLQLVVTARAQDAATAALAGRVTIQPTVDAGSATIRLAPIGVNIPIPADLAVRKTNIQPDMLYLDAATRDGFSIFLTFNFYVQDPEGKCVPPDKRESPKNADALRDPRWSVKVSEEKWVYLCLQLPQGVVQLESSPPQKTQLEALRQLTAAFADAFLPGTAKPATVVASSAPAEEPFSSVYVGDLMPRLYVNIMNRCILEEDPTSCRNYESFRALRKECEGTNAAMCARIAEMAKDQPKVAAPYYRRACELGDKPSCRKADQQERKIKD